MSNGDLPSRLQSYLDNALGSPESLKFIGASERKAEAEQRKFAKEEIKLLQAVTAQVEAETDSYRQDTGLRKEYATKIYDFLNVWITFVVIFTTLYAMGVLKPDVKVVLALLGTTTISIVGIFMAVARYLFPDVNAQKRGSKSGSKKED